MSRYFDYSYYKSHIGQTYYVNDSLPTPHQQLTSRPLEDPDEELDGRIDEPMNTRLKAGTDDEPCCIRYTLLTFFTAVALIAAYLFWMARKFEFKFEFFDAMVLAVVIVAVIGAVGTLYRNAFLLGFIALILICVGIFFIFFMLVASYCFLFDEEKFRRIVVQKWAKQPKSQSAIDKCV
ncbi:hypothetical protein RB195_005687 [Necator americanus]|uniref:Tetraspanin family protein n=1 Tax=Necator americanus TaxID=51031 RepID=A0ABR1BP37_NECAM